MHPQHKKALSGLSRDAIAQISQAGQTVQRAQLPPQSCRLPGLGVGPGNGEDWHQLSRLSGSGEMGSLPELRGAGLTRFQSSSAHPGSLGLPSNRCCLPFWGPLCRPVRPGFLGGRERACNPVHHFCLPAGRSSLQPAGPTICFREASASGRVLHGGFRLSLNIALVPLEVQWQKTNVRMSLGNVT